MKTLFFVSAIAMLGCSSGETATASSTAAGTAQQSTTPAASVTTPPVAQDVVKKDVPVDQLINSDGKIDAGLPKTAAPGAKMPKNGDPIVILTTNQGRIVVKFFPEKAPNHVKNFLDLAGRKFYDGTKFHRVIPGFMIQGGDPNTKNEDTSTWGQGGPGYTVKQEFNDIPHTPGILSMARTQDPDGAGSQFFIIHKTSSFLDGQYTVFGQVIEGMDVVNKIVNVPCNLGGDGHMSQPKDPQVIEKAEVTKWPVTLK